MTENPGSTSVPLPPAGAPLPKGALVAAPIVFVVTAVVGIVLIVLSAFTVVDAVRDFRQVRAGETRTLVLDPGDWYVVVGGPPGSIAATTVEVVDRTGRAPTRVVDPASVDVDLDGNRYRAVGAFVVPRTGAYRVTVDGPSGADVRIGRVPLTRFVLLLVGGIAFGGIGFLVALVLLIVGLWVRSTAKKRRAATGAPG